MARWGFRIFAVASALLCLATVILWIASQSRTDTLHYTRPYTAISLTATRAGAHIEFRRLHQGCIDGRGLHWSTDLSTPRVRRQLYATYWHVPGITYDSGPSLISSFRFNENRWSLTFAWWLLAILTAAPLLLHLRLHRRRLQPGHCSKCGYDLRATPDRCPECGTAAAVAR